MRWRAEPKPKDGEERVISAFLWWPRTIGGETRWLETASWRQWLEACFFDEWRDMRWEDAK